MTLSVSKSFSASSMACRIASTLTLRIAVTTRSAGRCRAMLTSFPTGLLPFFEETLFHLTTHSIKKHDAIQVVKLVMGDSGVPLRDMTFLRFADGVEVLHDDIVAALDLFVEAGQGQAALAFVCKPAVELQDGVHDHNGFAVFVVGKGHDENAGRDADLRTRKADTFFRHHGLNHVLAEGFELRPERRVRDRLGDLRQDGVIPQGYR